ncbi:hypothetical protein B0H34DRAFT_801164 [Crassisporium funariophilum]|nr:hypothetical protein B0H34DRAFT_801164 [Crassisporium funariophilum]
MHSSALYPSKNWSAATKHDLTLKHIVYCYAYFAEGRASELTAGLNKCIVEMLGMLAVPAPTGHANGAAEIAFQANIVPINLPAVPEEPAIPVQINATSPIAYDQADNSPFFWPASASVIVIVRFDLPRTPPSVGAESFGTPSPTQLEIDTRQANVSPNRQTPGTNITLGHHTPTPHTPGIPRAGRHSPLHARHREQHWMHDAKKLKATVVWLFFKKDGHSEHACLFCKQQHAVNPAVEVQTYAPETGTTFLLTHQTFQACVNEYHKQNGTTQRRKEDPLLPKQAYSQEAFIDAIVEWIVADNQSLNVVDCPKLQSLFCMLHEDLCDSNIPWRTHIQTRIVEVWDKHIAKLKSKMNSSLGKISTAMDLWTNANLSPFMAVTAHWIEVETIPTPQGAQYNLQLHLDLPSCSWASQW